MKIKNGKMKIFWNILKYLQKRTKKSGFFFTLDFFFTAPMNLAWKCCTRSRELATCWVRFGDLGRAQWIFLLALRGTTAIHHDVVLGAIWRLGCDLETQAAPWRHLRVLIIWTLSLKSNRFKNKPKNASGDHGWRGEGGLYVVAQPRFCWPVRGTTAIRHVASSVDLVQQIHGSCKQKIPAF